MKRFLMREKWLSFGNDFSIADERGHPVYFVDGRAFSFGEKLSFQDMQKRELAFISQKLLSWGPTYEISQNGKVVAVVKKKLFTLFKCRFMVDVPGPDDLEAQGNLFDHDYVFRRHGEEVAEVSKRWVSFTDTYGIEVSESVDPILVLASAVVIDLACHEDKKH